MAHAYNFDNWDPMADSYQDANINSYEHGPGANLTPYARAPANAEYKLYVSNIPAELEETGIRQVFNQYGRTLNVMCPKGASWAFVTFTSFREAETAVRVLNNAPPLNLNVTFAKKKEEEPIRKITQRVASLSIEPVPVIPVLENQRICNENQYISPEHQQYNRPLVRNLGRGKELAALARRAIAPPPGLRYHENDDLLYPVFHDPNIYDPYEEDCEAFSDTNTMWARGRLQVSNNGSRYVTMGRGCTWYELPTPHPRVNQQIRSVYEKREPGLYEFGQNKFPQQIGQCQYCAKPALMRCQRCREVYCSRPCQEADWPRHKVECQPMPGLKGRIDSGSLSISSGDEVLPPGQERRSIRKLRRPINPAAVPIAPNSTSTPLAGTSPKSGISAAVPSHIVEPNGKEDEPFASQDNLKRNHLGNQKSPAQQNKSPNPGGWNPLKSSGENQPLYSFKNRGEGINANQKTNSSSELMPLMKQDCQDKQESKNSSSQGSLENRNTKHRSAATAPNHRSETLQDGQPNRNFFNRGDRGHPEQRSHQQITNQVKNLDNNTTETAKPVRKPLPDPDVQFYKATDLSVTSTVKSSPKVSFQGTTSNAVVTAPGNRSIDAVNDTSEKAPVQASERTQALNTSATSIPSCKASTSARKTAKKNVVELLDVDEEGCFEVHVLLGGKKAAITVCVLKFQSEYARISSELTLECEKMPNSVDLQPKVGDFVCGKRLDDWIRGTVASLGPPMRLAAVDEGRMEPVTSVQPIPQGYANLPTLGAVCELTEGDFELQPLERYTFVAVKNNSENVSEKGVEIVVFSADDKEGKAILKPWTPVPEQKGIPFTILTSGTEVSIASFRSQTSMFVRSLVPKDMELFNRVTQDIARWSTNAPKFTEPPVIGEIVVAKYAEDGNFYRAIVRQVRDTKIMVSYVDYGNVETTTLGNLRQISPKLKEYSSCVARIVLKNVPKDVAMTDELNKYLAMLAGQEKPLMCTFEGSPVQDGVILKEANGTCVNDKIVELLTPSWKKEEDKTSVFLVGDLEVAELGAVGQTLNVLNLFSYGPLMHAMAPQDMELIGHVTGVMAADIKAYCEQLKDHYIPRQDELCLAPYEGLWYRAVCLEPTTTTTTSTVNFIDFGNIETIAHTDLRVMTKDFMTTKTLASVCQVIGLGPLDKDGDLPLAVASRVTELIPQNGVTLVKIVECTKPGEYVIELPDIRETLIKEGLLKL